MKQTALSRGIRFMSRRSRLALASAAAILVPAVAFGHPGHADSGGLAQGFAHPFGGLDHVMAMVAVGLLAARSGGRALFCVPASFLGMMAFGGALGFAGVQVPAIEAGIALSVVVLGLMAALRAAMGVTAAALLAGLFAVFHGAAHAAEIPAAADGLTYAAGFLAATALLHAAGLAAGLAGRTSAGLLAPSLRAAAAATSLAGVGLLAGWL
jgi:urease accessory protein